MMSSFSTAFFDTLMSIGVPADRARTLVELLDRSIDERYGLHAQIIATKRDVAELETRLARDIAEARVDLVKWLLGALTAQTALIAGIVKLF